MRLLTHHENGSLEAAIQIGDVIVPVRSAARRSGLDDSLASTRRVLGASGPARDALQVAAQELAAAGGPGVRALGDVTLGPPVPDPDKIICLGLNYHDHTAEMKLEQPPLPPLFAKFRNALIGSGSPIVLPTLSNEVDFEGELALVIGRRCREVAPDEALGVIAGYMALNDVSARDLQMESGQWTAGKVLDGFAPCGPCVVTADEIADAQSLEIETRVNGEVVQRASTAEMIVGIAETVSRLSALLTLEVGDIIATGTPSGVGYSRDPQMFLNHGDVVEVEIEGLGTLQNPVAAPAHDPVARRIRAGGGHE